jgi:hypothetical protein
MNTLFDLYLVAVIMSFILFLKKFNIENNFSIISYKIVFSNSIIIVTLRKVKKMM